MPYDREFRKGHGGLLREACSRVCDHFGINFKKSDDVPIYEDKYGWIAIPITDGFQTFYLMARSYLYIDSIASIEKPLLESALEKKLWFILWVAQIDKWYILDPRDIMVHTNHKEGTRGDKVYFDFEPERLHKTYQVHFRDRQSR